MPAIVCPWCQSEIIQEEGAEPEKWCPVCENELDGYRTLRISLGRDEEDLEEEGDLAAEEEDLSWETDNDLREKNGDLLHFEEQVERLLDEQDIVPECPGCREYMVEAGEQTVPSDSFRPRLIKPEGQAVLEAPFSMTLYVCPSCFAVTRFLTEASRLELMRRFSRNRP